MAPYSLVRMEEDLVQQSPSVGCRLLHKAKDGLAPASDESSGGKRGGGAARKVNVQAGFDHRRTSALCATDIDVMSDY